MPRRPRSSPSDILPASDRAARRKARLVAAAIRAGRGAVDEAFDGFLPEELRAVSSRYWTPLPVARRAAFWLREIQARTVVDIGSGAGKFCVAGALLTRCQFIGLEQRASLVATARGLAEAFGVADRVTFEHGSIGVAPAPVGDTYYLFNPFGDYVFETALFDEPGVLFSQESFDADIAAATALLAQAPVGTFVITLNGFGGRFPRGYEQIDIGFGPQGTLRLWKKRHPG